MFDFLLWCAVIAMAFPVLAVIASVIYLLGWAIFIGICLIRLKIYEMKNGEI